VLPNGCPHVNGDIIAQLDDGCEYTMLAPENAHLLHRASARPGPPMKGATKGPPQRSVGSEFLRFQFPSATATIDLLPVEALPILAAQLFQPATRTAEPLKTYLLTQAPTSDDPNADHIGAPTCQRLSQLGLLGSSYEAFAVTRSGHRKLEANPTSSTPMPTLPAPARVKSTLEQGAHGGPDKEELIKFYTESLDQLRPSLRRYELDKDKPPAGHEQVPPSAWGVLRRLSDVCDNAMKKRERYMTSRLLELTGSARTGKDDKDDLAAMKEAHAKGPARRPCCST
jgi:hypothetical protein